MSDIVTKVKNKIRVLTAKKGITIYELSKQSGVSEACIRNWYSKRNYQPSLDSLVNICEVLDLSLSQLFVAEDENFYPVNEESKKFLNCFLALNVNTKKHILGIMEALSGGKQKDVM